LVVAAFRVITASSPVTGVLHLILAFFTASMIWMLQGAEFLSLLLVLVYVGAVMVLFLSVVMMLDVRMDALRAGFKTYLPMGLIIGLIMVLEMSFVLAKSWLGAGPKAVTADDVDKTRVLGVAMYTDYAFAVHNGGVILLVGMTAGIALTQRRRADVKRNTPAEQFKVKGQDRLRTVSIASKTDARAKVDADQEQG